MSEKDKKIIIDTTYFRTAAEIIEQKINVGTLPIGPALDAKTGGGIPDGSMVLFRTLSGVGKTTCAMQIAKNALDQDRYVIYCDAESRGGTPKFFKIKGFDLSNPKFIYFGSQPGEPILSGEKIYRTIKDMMLLPKYNGAVYIIDSFSKITPFDTLEDAEIKANRRDGTPKLNADFCKKIGNLLRCTNSIVIGIQHFITNTSGYGDPLVPDGGIKLDYDSDIVFDARHKPFGWDGKRINVKKGDKLEGQLIEFLVTKNKNLAPWLSKEDPVKCFIKFDEGIWWGAEAFDLLFDLGFITKREKGFWFDVNISGFSDSANGRDNMIEVLETNREKVEPFIKEYFKTTYGANYDIKYNCESEEPESSEKKSKKSKK